MATAALYLGRSMKELNAMAADIPRINSAKLFIGTAEQAFKKAQEHQQKGDEEMSYVMYMRFFNIFTAIKKAPDYKRSQAKVDERLGTDKCNRAIEQAELLAKNLQKRYAELDAFTLRREMAALRIMQEQKTPQQPGSYGGAPSRSASARAPTNYRPPPVSRAKSDDNYTYLEPL